VKKYIITISTMLIISGNICSAKTAGDVKNAFLTATNMFYAQPSDQTTITAYYRAANDITSFVEDHSKNVVGSGRDVTLNTAAKELEAIMKNTIDLVNTIKMNRNINADSDFAMLTQRCNAVKKMLSKENFIVADKKEAKDVLMYELEILNDMIKFAMEDYSKNVRKPIKIT
jgi:TRAP-type mannitol/chloroaromatic compound transport system substrate-binding protein